MVCIPPNILHRCLGQDWHIFNNVAFRHGCCGVQLKPKAHMGIVSKLLLLALLDTHFGRRIHLP